MAAGTQLIVDVSRNAIKSLRKLFETVFKAQSANANACLAGALNNSMHTAWQQITNNRLKRRAPGMVHVSKMYLISDI
jgi:ribose 1,5-bisphosphokinase PhnN